MIAAFDAAGRQIGIVFETASLFETPMRMEALVTWFRAAEGERALHTLFRMAIFVVEFLAIHPFQDGNGRLSRVLTILLLLRAGYAHVPFSSLESVVEQSKEAYYLSLRQTQATLRSDAPDWRPWLVFLLRALHRQMRALASKIERERIVLAVLPPLSLRILEHAREHGRVTMADAIRLTGARRNTLKDHFRKLVQERRLVRQGAGRGVWYGLG